MKFCKKCNVWWHKTIGEFCPTCNTRLEWWHLQ